MAKYTMLAIEADAKTKKGNKRGFLTAILYLAPATEADGVHNMCTMATAECINACLYDAGMSEVFPTIKAGRIRKTLMYLNDRERFMALVRADMHKAIAEAKKRRMTLVVRINGTSDQPQLARELAVEFPTIQFYDYTKIPQPWKRTMANYHLTFSYSGENMSACLDALEHGINVAVVFSGGLPATWHGFQVVNGDLSDLRFLDAKGVIVGLTPKGRTAKQITPTANGFIQIGGVN